MQIGNTFHSCLLYMLQQWLLPEEKHRAQNTLSISFCSLFLCVHVCAFLHFKYYFQTPVCLPVFFWSLTYTGPDSSKSHFYSDLFWKCTFTVISTRLSKATNNSSLTSCPAVYCYSEVWLVCLGGAIHWNDVRSQRAEIWFRGKFANVLTRVEGSEGNCERARLKKHSINWSHIKIRLPGELLDNSNAFKKGVWAKQKKKDKANEPQWTQLPIAKNKTKSQQDIYFIWS